MRAQTTFTDAAAHGKAMVITDAADARPVPGLKKEPEEDEVEKVLGHPQNK